MSDNTTLNPGAVPMSSAGIYMITASNGKRYIGSAHNFSKRWHKHRADLKSGCHHSRALQNIFNAHGLDGLRFERMLVCDRSLVLYYEQRAFEIYKPELNGAKIAGNCSGVKHTPETRKRSSDRQKLTSNTGRFKKGMPPTMLGKKHSDESKSKQSLAKLGKPGNPKAIEAMRSVNTGRKPSEASVERIASLNKGGMSEEHKMKLSEAAKRRWADKSERDKQAQRTKQFWSNHV